jgi:DNA-binding protein HU-beta
MTKRELVNKISEKTNFTRENTETAVNAFIETIREAMIEGEDKIAIVGIGTIKRKVRAARTCRNPQNGEAINVPEKVVYTLKCSPDLLNSING